MKGVIGMVLGMLSLFGAVWAQKVDDIIALPLQVATRKTSNLIFPASVRNVDRGSPDILVQKARGLENVLQVKAGRPDFKETSLTVITDDGKLYAFTLTYSDHPSPLNLKVLPVPSRSPEARFEKPGEYALEETAMQVSTNPSFLKRLSDRKNGVSLRLQGIYIQDQVMYYQFWIENKTPISYDVSQFRFSIRDRKQAKRTAIQQESLPLLFALDKTERIPGGQGQQIVIALEKRTIPDQKILLVQLMEEKGGRHLFFRLQNRDLMKARPVRVD